MLYLLSGPDSHMLDSVSLEKQGLDHVMQLSTKSIHSNTRQGRKAEVEHSVSIAPDMGPLPKKSLDDNIVFTNP